MKKGNYGIYLSFYAVLALALAFLGQTMLCALLLGFVIFAEKDEWLTRQAMQALMLALLSSVVYNVLSVADFIKYIPFIGAVWGAVVGLINTAVDIVILVFVIIGITKVLKGEDASVPVFSDWAAKAYGSFAAKKAAPAQMVKPAQMAQPTVPSQDENK